jgi:hypothetical protein
MTSCQPVWHTRIVLRNVAVVVVNGFLPFEFGTICEVFGVDRADDRLPSYQLSVVAGESPPGRVRPGPSPRNCWRRCAGRWTGAPGC